jgi:hypothetical protein
MLCCQGTTIQESVMPSVLKLIKRCVERQLDYLGLTNIGLTEQMFGQILKELKSIQPRKELKSVEPRSKHSKPVLEMNYGMAKLSQMTVEQYSEFCTEQSRLGIIIKMSQPKREKTTYVRGMNQDRDQRAEKRAASFTRRR